jgi:ElaB/YqjD/DUF883 family membrane-anchored ribosome-binding protein
MTRARARGGLQSFARDVGWELFPLLPVGGTGIFHGQSTSMSSTSGTIRDTVRETTRDAKDAVRESGKAASAASGDIQADLQVLRDDVTRLASQIADIFATKGNAVWARARSNVEGVVSDVSAKGQEAVDAVQEAGDRVIDVIDESLRTRPYTTLAVALGIGFLFGAMWRK